MELLILGALAGAGYALNQKGKETRYDHKDIRRDPGMRYPVAPGDVKVQAEDRSLYDKRWLASLDPAQTGIVPAGMGASALGIATDLKDATGRPVQPFFSSERKQHTSTQLKQSRLELFTGAIYEDKSQTGFYRHKEEQKPFFNPTESAVKVSFSGSAGNPAYKVDADRYTVHNKKHHMAPTEQVRVGPGINVGPDVPSSGGFHEQFRILPPNVGGYKKNNLPGRIVPGASGVAQRGMAGPVNKNQPEREAPAPGPAPGRADRTAPTGRTQHFFQDGQLVGDQYFGIQGSAVAAKHAPGAGLLTNVKDDGTDRGVVGITNVAATRAGMGAYTYTEHDPRATDRSQETQGLTGVRGAPAMYAKQDPLMGNTNRSFGAGGAMSFTPAGSAVSNTQARPGNVPQTTHRELTGASNYIGGATAAISGASHSDRTYITKNADQARARRDNTLHSYTPGPGRVNIVKGETGALTTSNTQYTNRAPLSATVDIGARAIQVTEKRQALQQENPRMWAP